MSKLRRRAVHIFTHAVGCSHALSAKRHCRFYSAPAHIPACILQNGIMSVFRFPRCFAAAASENAAAENCRKQSIKQLALHILLPHYVILFNSFNSAFTSMGFVTRSFIPDFIALSLSPSKALAVGASARNPRSRGRVCGSRWPPYSRP